MPRVVFTNYQLGNQELLQDHVVGFNRGLLDLKHV